MSAIKLKNDIVRKLRAAVGAGTLPAGVEFEAQLKNRRIWVHIVAAPFDALKPGRITLGDHFMSYALSLMAPPEKDHTPEACKLLADAETIVKGACAQGAYVTFGSECYDAQGRRMKAAQAPKPATAPSVAAAL